MDHFELVSEYAPTGDQPEAIVRNARHCSVSQVPVRHLRWRMSSPN